MRGWAILLILAAVMAAVWMGGSEENAEPRREVMETVRKAVAEIDAGHTESLLARITARDEAFTKGNLYLVAYDLNGKCLAHGQNPFLVGRDMEQVRDVNGRAYIRERIQMAASTMQFWHSYLYTNPISGRIESKKTYCERHKQILVCGGFYEK